MDFSWAILLCTYHGHTDSRRGHNHTTSHIFLGRWECCSHYRSPSSAGPAICVATSSTPTPQSRPILPAPSLPPPPPCSAPSQLTQETLDYQQVNLLAASRSPGILTLYGPRRDFAQHQSVSGETLIWGHFHLAGGHTPTEVRLLKERLRCRLLQFLRDRLSVQGGAREQWNQLCCASLMSQTFCWMLR